MTPKYILFTDSREYGLFFKRKLQKARKKQVKYCLVTSSEENIRDIINIVTIRQSNNYNAFLLMHSFLQIMYALTHRPFFDTGLWLSFFKHPFFFLYNKKGWNECVVNLNKSILRKNVIDNENDFFNIILNIEHCLSVRKFLTYFKENFQAWKAHTLNKLNEAYHNDSTQKSCYAFYCYHIRYSRLFLNSYSRDICDIDISQNFYKQNTGVKYALKPLTRQNYTNFLNSIKIAIEIRENNLGEHIRFLHPNFFTKKRDGIVNFENTIKASNTLFVDDRDVDPLSQSIPVLFSEKMCVLRISKNKDGSIQKPSTNWLRTNNSCIAMMQQPQISQISKKNIHTHKNLFACPNLIKNKLLFNLKNIDELYSQPFHFYIKRVLNVYPLLPLNTQLLKRDRVFLAKEIIKIILLNNNLNSDSILNIIQNTYYKDSYIFAFFSEFIIKFTEFFINWYKSFSRHEMYLYHNSSLDVLYKNDLYAINGEINHWFESANKRKIPIFVITDQKMPSLRTCQKGEDLTFMPLLSFIHEKYPEIEKALIFVIDNDDVSYFIFDYFLDNAKRQTSITNTHNIVSSFLKKERIYFCDDKIHLVLNFIDPYEHLARTY